MADSIWCMLVAFLSGGAVKLFGEWFRARYLRIAVTNPIRGEEAVRFEKWASQWSGPIGWFMLLYFMLWPERALRRVRDDLERRGEGEEPCSSRES